MTVDDNFGKMLDVSVQKRRAEGERRNSTAFRPNATDSSTASQFWTKPHKQAYHPTMLNHRKHSSKIFREAVGGPDKKGRPCFFGVRDYL